MKNLIIFTLFLLTALSMNAQTSATNNNASVQQTGTLTTIKGQVWVPVVTHSHEEGRLYLVNVVTGEVRKFERNWGNKRGGYIVMQEIDSKEIK